MCAYALHGHWDSLAMDEQWNLSSSSFTKTTIMSRVLRLRLWVNWVVRKPLSH